MGFTLHSSHAQKTAQVGALAFGQAETKIAANSTFSRIGCRQDDGLSGGTLGSQAVGLRKAALEFYVSAAWGSSEHKGAVH